MLRKDTVYITKQHWEPRVPSVEEIKRQLEKKPADCENATRLNMGKIFIGKSQ